MATIFLDVATSIVSSQGRSLRLSRLEGRMLAAMASRGTAVMSREAVALSAYAHRPDTPSSNVVSVAVARMKSKFRAAGIRFPVVSHRGQGISCDDLTLESQVPVFALSKAAFADLQELLATHPDTALADRVWASMQA